MRRPWWDHLVRLGLQAFPEGFRERWGAEMHETVAHRVNAAQRMRGATPWAVIIRETTGLIGAGWRERLHSNTWQLQMIHAQDIRYALRLLFRSPGFTLLTVLVLAGGLGLSTFTFSFLHTAMVRPLPLGEGERIVRLDQTIQGRGGSVDAVDVAALRQSMRTARELGAYGGRDLILGMEGKRRVIDATTADPVLFTIARTPAFLGRPLLPSDAEEGAEPVVVLSYRTWEVAFGADRAIINQQVPLSGVSTRVVGVMPEGYGFPVASEAWEPLPRRVYASTQPGINSVRLVARLAPEVTYEQASLEGTGILRPIVVARDTSVKSYDVQLTAVSFPEAQIGPERNLVFVVLNLLAALILLLAIVNVTNLLLARANERVRETAVRLALGASTGRLVMQGMWESILLCVTGGIVGTAFASWGLAAITRWTQRNMEGNLAFWWVWQMDHVTILSAGAFVTLAIAALGAVVSRRATRTNMREVMQDGSARSGARREGRMSRVLVTTQVTTVTVLLFFGVMAGVMARRIVKIDMGYDTNRMLQGGVAPAEGRYATSMARAELYRGLAARLGEQEALEATLLRNTMAEKSSTDAGLVLRDERTTGARPVANLVAALGNLATVGVRVVEGRAFASSDDQSRESVAMVSQSLAARLWPGRSPVGEQVRLASVGDTTRWHTIVGVVSNIPFGNPLARDRSPDVLYVSLLQTPTPFATVFARYQSTEVGAREGLARAVELVDPLLTIDGVQPLSAVLERVALIARAVAKLFGACFAFALLLAVAGTYGLMSRSIGLRRREIGVRRALGASEGSVTRLLLVQGTRQLGLGTIVAAPLLVIVGLVFNHYFPVGGAVAVVAAVAVSATIIAVVLLATWVPTRRVLRVTPRDALWSD